MTQGLGWAADPAAALEWQHWGEAHFAFDARSGQTHFLNEIAAAVLAVLATHTLTQAALYEAMLARYEVDDDTQLLTGIVDTLRVLDRLGLIQRVPS